MLSFPLPSLYKPDWMTSDGCHGDARRDVSIQGDAGKVQKMKHEADMASKGFVQRFDQSG